MTTLRATQRAGPGDDSVAFRLDPVVGLAEVEPAAKDDTSVASCTCWEGRLVRAEQRDPATMTAGGFPCVKNGWIRADSNGIDEEDPVLSDVETAGVDEGNGMDSSLS